MNYPAKKLTHWLNISAQQNTNLTSKDLRSDRFWDTAS